MAQTIKLKRSGTQNAVPTTSQLALGEVALNTYDGKMYIKKSVGGSESIVEIGGDATSSSGLDFTGNLNLADNVRIVIGDGNDLQIYHDGSDSYITDGGTGNLKIQADDLVFKTADGSKEYLKGTASGSVRIRHNNSTKFETTSTGVTITGSLASGAITANNGSTASIPLTIGSGSSTSYTLQRWVTSAHSGSTAYIIAYGASHGAEAGNFAIKNLEANSDIFFELAGGVEPLRLTSSGITVTGTIVADGLDLGDDNILNVGTIAVDKVKGDADDNTNITFAGNDVTAFYQGGAEKIRIDADGRLLINTTSSIDNLSQLHIVGPTSGRAGITLQDGDSTTQKTFFTQDGGVTRFSTQSGTSYGSFAISGWNGTTSADLVRVTGDGRVGIGTNAPEHPLHVSFSGDNGAQIKSTDNHASLYINAGSGYGSYIRFEENNAQNYWINADTNGRLLFRPAGGSSNWISFGSTGQVGIGTVTPNRQLHILKSGTTSAIMIEAGDGNQSSVDLKNTEGWFRLINDGGSLSVYDQSDSAERFRINTSGNFEFSNGNFTEVGTISSGAITTSSSLNFTNNPATIQNSEDNSGQIIIQARNSSGDFYGVRWDVANASTGALRPSHTNNSNLGLTNRIWNTLYVNNIRMGSNNDQFVDANRNINAGNITATGFLRGPSTFTIDPSAHGDNTGTVVIAGNLQVDGTTTTINSTTLTVDDKNITLASGASNAAAANGAGITVDTVGAQLTYDATQDRWNMNKGLELLGTPLVVGTGATDVGRVENSSGVFSLTAYSGRQIAFGNDTNGEHVRVDANGNVGIGNTSPVAKLHVQENTSVTYDATAYQHDLFLEKRNTGGANQTTGLRFAVTGYDGSTTAEASIGILQTSNAHSGNLVFGTRHSGTRAERMRITSDGNVGIGEASPDRRLHVKDSTLVVSKFESSNSGGVLLDLENAAVPASHAGAYAGIRFYNSSGFDMALSHITESTGNGYVQIGESWDGTSTIFKAHSSGAVTFNDAFTFPTTDGSANQILKTDGSGNVTWATEAAVSANTSISDADGDTKIQVEESADEDIIRFDAAGTERMTLSPSVLSVRGTTNPEIELLPNGTVGNADLRFDGTTFDIRSNSSSASLLLSTSSTERLRITSSGNVGINSASPAKTLTVGGTFQATGEAFFSHFDNTTSSSRMRDNLRLNFGTARTFAILGNSTNMHIRNSNTDVMTFDTSNRVGIGNTSPGYTLDVSGQIHSTAAYIDGYIYHTGDSDTYIQYSTDTIILSAGAQQTYFKGNGRVGIGTTDPAAPLHLKGTGDTTLIVEADSDNSGETDNARIELRQDGNNVAGYLYTEGNAGQTATGTLANTTVLESKGGGNDVGIHFATGGRAPAQSGGELAGTVRMTILGSGDVGIGTTTPDEFSIGGSYRYLAVGGDKPGIINLVDSGTSGSYLQFGTAAGVRRASIHTDASASDLVFTLNSSNSGTSLSERFRIKASNGYVGIGTNNPVQKLQVDGNIYANGGQFYVNNNSGISAVGDLVLKTHSGSGYQTSMHLDGADNHVGIGTTSPSQKLTVRGATLFSAGDEGSRHGTEFNWVKSNTGSSGNGVWYKVADITLTNTAYSAMSFEAYYETGLNNFGSHNYLDVREVFVSIVRNNTTSTNNSPDSATLRGRTSDIRVYKTAAGTYELQARHNSQNAKYAVRVRVFQTNGGTITPKMDGSTAGTTSGGTEYTVSEPATTEGVRRYLADIDSSRIHLGSVDIFPSGNTNYIHVSGSGVIPQSTTASSNGSLGTSTYIWNGVFSRRFQGEVGTAGAPTFTFFDDSNTGMYDEWYVQADSKRQLSFSVDGVRRMHINEAGIWSAGNFYLPNNGGSLRSFHTYTEISNGTSGNGFRMRNSADNVDSLIVTSAGNGTFAGTLTVKAGDAATSAHSITSNGGDLVLKAGADDVVLRTGGSGSEGIYFQDGAQDTKMFINAENGNVGIGSTAPQNVLDLGNGTNGRGIAWGGSNGTAHYNTIWSEYSSASIIIGAGLKGATGSSTFLNPFTGTYGYAAIELDSFSDDGIKFYTGADSSRTKDATITPTEHMRLTNGGYLMIGKTNPTFSTSGIELRSGNLGARFTRSNAEPILVNRTGSNGDIVKFYGQSTHIGSIGTGDGNSVYIECPVSTKVGLDFRSDILPRSGGALSNGGVDLGAPSYRFRNIELSAAANIGHASIQTNSTTTSATTQVAIDAFVASQFRSAEFTIQVTNSTDSTYHMTKVLLIHDGTTPGITEYGTVFTGSAVEATFDADISSGNVRLLATPASTDSMTFKVVRHCITV